MTGVLHVLIVEDNPADAFLISEILNGIDIPMDIVVVRDGQAALDFLGEKEEWGAEGSLDIVILDLNIPKVNGFEVLRCIRASPAHRLLPVMIMTGSLNKDDEMRAREMGVTDFRIKPASTAEMDAITQWLRSNLVVLAGG